MRICVYLSILKNAAIPEKNLCKQSYRRVLRGVAYLTVCNCRVELIFYGHIYTVRTSILLYMPYIFISKLYELYFHFFFQHDRDDILVEGWKKYKWKYSLPSSLLYIVCPFFSWEHVYRTFIYMEKPGLHDIVSEWRQLSNIMSCW